MKMTNFYLMETVNDNARRRVHYFLLRVKHAQHCRISYILCVAYFRYYQTTAR